MKYEVNPANTDAFIGTHLQGYVGANYAELVGTLGQPLADDFDGKADAVWMLVFEDGTVASVYNYKDGRNYLGDEGTPTEEIRDWHIGGKSQHAVELVHWLLGKQLEQGERATWNTDQQ